MFADISKEEFDEALYIARQKHASEEWIRGGLYFGKMALQSEVYEFFDAITDEPPERQKAELIDVLVVAYRLYNREWEKEKSDIIYLNKKFQNYEQSFKDIDTSIDLYKKTKDACEEQIINEFLSSCPLCGATPVLMVDNEKYACSCPNLDCENAELEIKTRLLKAVIYWNSKIEKQKNKA